jgi:hypothetical protein
MKDHKTVLRTPFVLLLLLCLPALTVNAQQGAVSAPRTLQQLTGAAKLIVRGRVLSVHGEPHPQYSHLQTAIVTVRVDAALKGSPGNTYTFRQYVWDIRDTRAPGGYRQGQEVLLFLNATNENGLTSPTGLEQGFFQIERDESGKAMAVNGRGNEGLLQGRQQSKSSFKKPLTAQAQALLATHKQGPISLDVLSGLITSMVEAR